MARPPTSSAARLLTANGASAAAVALAILVALTLVVSVFADLGQTGAVLGAAFAIPLVLLLAGQYAGGAAHAASRGTVGGWVRRGLAVTLLLLAALIFSVVAGDVGAYDTDSPIVLLVEALVWSVWISIVGLFLTLPVALVYFAAFVYSVREHPSRRLRVPAIALAVGVVGGTAAAVRDADGVFLALAATTLVIAVAYSVFVRLPTRQSERAASQ